MNILDHLLNENIRTNKDQLNEAIYNDPKFDTSSFNSSSGTRDPLPVVTVTLRGGKKHRETNVAGLTCLWGSGSTDRMISRKHTEYYEQKIQYNNVEYSTVFLTSTKCLTFCTLLLPKN